MTGREESSGGTEHTGRCARMTPTRFISAGVGLLAVGSVAISVATDSASALLLLGTLAGGIGMGVTLCGSWMKQKQLEGRLNV